MDELQKLCDEVPEFSNEKAFQIFKDELGIDVNDVFTDISSKPIAAASIG
jgi:aarF domain-containing kinase